MSGMWLGPAPSLLVNSTDPPNSSWYSRTFELQCTPATCPLIAAEAWERLRRLVFAKRAHANQTHGAARAPDLIERSIASRVDVVGEGKDQSLVFTTNVGDLAEAGQDHPITVEVDEETGEPTPLVRVRGKLDALMARPVFYELAERAVEHEGVMGVWSGGEFYPLGAV